MMKLITNNILISVSILSIILLLIPVTLFLYHFGGKTISDDLSNWALFGDFVGGILNTILSLSSLVILGLLTHNISKQSNEENKKNNLLLKRIESYDSLAYYLTEIHTSTSTISDKLSRLSNPRLTNEMKNKIITDVESEAKIFMQFYSLVLTFEERYSYLYEYDFLCKQYDELVDEARKFNSFFQELLQTREGKITPLVNPQINQKLEEVLKKLQLELK